MVVPNARAIDPLQFMEEAVARYPIKAWKSLAGRERLMGASATAPAATISPAALRPSTRCLGEIDVDVPRQPSCACYNVPQHRRNFLICQLLMRRLEEHRRILAP